VDLAAVVVDDRLRDEVLAEVLAEEDPETCRWCADRVVTVLDRPTGLLVAAAAAAAVVAVAVVVDVGAIDPAEGGRGGRSTVADVRAVAFDFARECVLVRCGCVLVGVVPVASEGGSWEEAGEGLEDADIDLDVGLVSLAVLVTVGLVVLDGSAGSLVVLCVTGFRTATVFRRPNTPEVGRLLVPAAADGIAVVVDGMPFPAPTVPARVRDAIVEPPGLGSLVGDVVLAAFGAELVGAAASLLLFVSLPVSSFLWVLLRPAVGCLSERDRPRAVAEVDDDDMISACRYVRMLGGKGETWNSSSPRAMYVCITDN
jgi:hypothetical protein